MTFLLDTLRVIEAMDSPLASGERYVDMLEESLSRIPAGPGRPHVTVTKLGTEKGSTDFVRLVVPGTHGKISGGTAPTVGIVGRLGGLGARPERIGFVSDGDGAAAALAAGLKLVRSAGEGERLDGDIVVSTHICPDAPTQPHDPVPFMDSPVDMAAMNEHEVTPEMDVVLSIDTTKGNHVVNHRGIAVSPTVRQGYILPVGRDVIRIAEQVTGEPLHVLPLSTQDITPYGNDLSHINSILQPATATEAPVVGIALTTQTAVAGCATGASHETDIALAARFAVEVAKEIGARTAVVHDEEEFQELVRRYGSARHLQTFGTSK